MPIILTYAPGVPGGAIISNTTFLAELVAKADEKVAYLKKDLREHYKGNLITQLGIQIDPVTKPPTM